TIKVGRVMTDSGKKLTWPEAYQKTFPGEFQWHDLGSRNYDESRAVGFTFEVTPEIGPMNQLITMTLHAEHCTHPRSIAYGFENDERTFEFKQPVFHSRSTTSTIVAHDGATIAVGVSDREHPDQYAFQFFTPRLIKPDGTPYRPDLVNDPAAARAMTNLPNEVPDNAGHNPLAMRFYPTRPDVFRGIRVDDYKTDANKSPAQVYFEQLGIRFPAGSTLSYDTEFQGIFTRNTRPNLKMMDHMFGYLQADVLQVEIDVAVVTFEEADLEPLRRNNPSPNIGQQPIRQLWKEGQGRIIGYAKTVTRTGYNTVIQSVEEVIYPSEFNSVMDHPFKNAVGVVPASLETRDIGMILNITPTVGPDNQTIELTLSPELNLDYGWRDDGHLYSDHSGRTRRVPVPQPFFNSKNVTTSIILLDGETIVQGATHRRLKGQATYMFVTPRLLNEYGEPIRKKYVD
ncbi:MAG: hypothetical protein AAF492_05665, partial [Verrucomicrobiota bacterium]